MKKSPENLNQETSDLEINAEINQPEVQKNKIEEEKPEVTEQKIEQLKQNIEDVLITPTEPGKKIEPEDVAKKIEDYQEKYLPDYLRKQPGLISNILAGLWRKRPIYCNL